MSQLVSLIHHGRVAVITINNPPVNALSFGVPEGLALSVEAAEADPAIDAIVIIGGGRTFVAGADINEFAKSIASGKGGGPDLTPFFTAIEDSAKPVVVAIHGAALGGGLELAMAAHYRVAVADAQVGLPEANLGIVPGAGGTGASVRQTIMGLDMRGPHLFGARSHGDLRVDFDGSAPATNGYAGGARISISATSIPRTWRDSRPQSDPIRG